MTAGHDRFKKEIERAHEGGIELVIIVEATIGRVAAGYEHSSFPGDSMVQKLFTLRERYGIETVFTSSRDESCYYIMHRWMAMGRERVRKSSGTSSTVQRVVRNSPEKPGSSSLA